MLLVAANYRRFVVAGLGYWPGARKVTSCMTQLLVVTCGAGAS
jgi:hypothetical protein